ncbi:hypothetical protein A3I34_00540 [Candidatus Jorgensenbacteria bacterium RIFCSPLOWO2_02_FULL_45_12]|nr:MAG: hypothetical protein A3I34_00540 [Candidatus Jorgensenbacteria bacterium RIFCSPLOWO2_02_FULL_45_12]
MPPEIQNFIEMFSKLPSVGPRMATRLAFYINSLGADGLKNLSGALTSLDALDRCGRCFFIKSRKNELCSFCASPARKQNLVAVVEKDTDVLSIEKSGKFDGVYCVIGELNRQNPLSDVQKERLQKLKNRSLEEFKNTGGEIIIALAPNTFGDFVAELIKQGFKNTNILVTRIGRGIPTGGEIEFADEETIRNAFDGRK